MFDTIIRNGHLVLEEGTVRADLAIKKGKIAALLGPDEPAECQKEIDAQGRLVLPGLIDAHMHTQAPFQGISRNLPFISKVFAPHLRVSQPIWILPILGKAQVFFRR